MPEVTKMDRELVKIYQNDWNKFAIDVLDADLDIEQKKILTAVQNNARVSVRSGTARGKDYVSAVAAVCFLYLFSPSKVICTAPTGRQAVDIMMGEIATIIRGAKINLGGRLLVSRISFKGNENWYLEAFKGEDHNLEAWSGIHSDFIMVIMTEASGLSEIIFQTIEGILQNYSRFLIVFNPNRLSGEAYRSTKSKRYVKMVLNDLDAPNVINWLEWKRGKITEEQYKKMKIPGQVDGNWVHDKVTEAGWCREITESEVQKEFYDFEWLGKYYRPGNLFRIKVLGQFPEEDEQTLLPMPWIEAAVERWKSWKKNYKGKKLGRKKVGSDIAGDGRDSTIHLLRYDDLVLKIHQFGQQTHMQASGFIKHLLKPGDTSLIDTIGEGAGVFSRLKELKTANLISVKNSYSSNNLRDITGELKFINMRAYTYWGIRDWMNPQFNSNAMIPDDPEFIQELNEIRYEYRSDGKIVIEAKDLIKSRLGRSPDKSDALALTFAPIRTVNKGGKGKKALGVF